MTSPTLISEKLLIRGDLDAGSLTIAIPTFRDDPSRLVSALAGCTCAEKASLLIYDDGTGDDTLTAACEAALQAWPGAAALISGMENHGRSHARNRLIAHARSDWILFLDADMLPDGPDFLGRYLDTMADQQSPALIAGGFSLDQISPSASQALHAAQSLQSECMSATERANDPGRYVFTSNILVHKTVLSEVSFDDGFSGWGWEDVDWGLRVAEAFPVIHVDNTATHLGLDDTDTLLAKYGESGANFARMVSRHPEAARSMKLTRAARKLAVLPGRSLIAHLSRWIAKSRLPNYLRLRALKLYRAATYAEHLR